MDCCAAQYAPISGHVERMHGQSFFVGGSADDEDDHVLGCSPEWYVQLAEFEFRISVNMVLPKRFRSIKRIQLVDGSTLEEVLQNLL